MDDQFSVNDHVVIRLFQVSGERFWEWDRIVSFGNESNIYREGLTIATEVQVQDAGDTDVDDTQEALVFALEFLLVEDLDGDDRRVLDLADGEKRRASASVDGGERGS